MTPYAGCRCPVGNVPCKNPNYNSDSWCIACSHWESCHDVPERAVAQAQAQDHLFEALAHWRDGVRGVEFNLPGPLRRLAQAYDVWRDLR